MASKIPVVFYKYDASPFAMKVKNALLLKKIPHYTVDVSMTAPRPELSTLLGISYRRIPILAIGSDVYCDTSLITSILERRFPQSSGYGTLFPVRNGSGGKRDTGMIKAWTISYMDRVIFPLGAACLPYNKFPAEFVKDRGEWLGKPIDVQKLIDAQPHIASTLSSHLTLLEEQLSDGREWLFDTESPGLGDLSAHFVYSWIQYFRALKGVLDPDHFPASIAWIARMTAYLSSSEKSNAAPFEKITGEKAAEIVTSSPFEDPSVVGFDTIEATRLGLVQGNEVSVAPDDSGKDVLTYGILVGLSREEVVLETRGTVGSAVRCHFPRLNFIVRSVGEGKSKL
ncbi:hypothetical protein JAAARDRAFT_144871 [Jaapia argillacea MUCL 33604]|uniref:GST N-terminal domain-containing protein n=1 Tax=Jaapia argillacea MUCL 33604 TaxID=933084 RepID=A0A067QL91_9AGAM|nr:hypothetical protein JAAARDRAFT_144871 [Jaapia argillacea MUCL 33604]